MLCKTDHYLFLSLFTKPANIVTSILSKFLPKMDNYLQTQWHK